MRSDARQAGGFRLRDRRHKIALLAESGSEFGVDGVEAERRRRLVPSLLPLVERGDQRFSLDRRLVCDQILDLVDRLSDFRLLLTGKADRDLGDADRVNELLLDPLPLARQRDDLSVIGLPIPPKLQRGVGRRPSSRLPGRQGAGSSQNGAPANGGQSRAIFRISHDPSSY
ncbi:hypothetical protein [Methylosinus sporium]|uniref:hypothetical protein n=1 Tax=Methylosinus sporium TaxID=428 RepID=UPI001330A5F5|nr:hypothetical protein [Methylosinus sporium]